MFGRLYGQNTINRHLPTNDCENYCKGITMSMLGSYSGIRHEAVGSVHNNHISKKVIILLIDMTAIELNCATNTRGIVYTEMLERLSDYQEYEKGWDGDNALPLSKQVVKNFKAFLQKSKDSELQGWTIFPAANGTLLLQNRERKSGINIGTNGYSYYEIVDGEVKGENNLKFSPKSVIETMKRI